MRAAFLAVLTLLLLSATPVSGVPIVAIDMDPSTAAIESVGFVAPGASFTINVVVIAVEPGAPLNGFELDVAYDPARMSALDLRAGGFLLPTVVEVQALLGPPEVEAAFTTLGASGASGSGILVSIDFTAPLTGTALLDLNDVILSAPFGFPIAFESVLDGAVVVPEPATGTLLALGLTALAWRRRALS